MAALFTALLTPFDSPTGSIQHARIAPHLRWLEEHGVDGIVPSGTTGEAQSMSMKERKMLFDTVFANRGNLRVIPGTGCAALSETIELSRYAFECGAEAVLVLPPFYFKAVSEEGLLAFYRAVCDALPNNAKIMLYHIPPVSQIAITPGIIAGLLESHPQYVYGLKDSGADPANTRMLIERFPSLQIFTGSAALLEQALHDGAAGGIFALANVFPRQMRAVIDAFEGNGDAKAAQRHVVAINDAIKIAAPIPALKALLPHFTGLNDGSTRVPLMNLSDEAKAALLDRVLAAVG